MDNKKNEEYVICPRCKQKVYKEAVTCPFCSFGIMAWLLKSIQMDPLNSKNVGDFKCLKIYFNIKE